jgi:hypothetical protein
MKSFTAWGWIFTILSIICIIACMAVIVYLNTGKDEVVLEKVDLRSNLIKCQISDKKPGKTK